MVEQVEIKKGKTKIIAIIVIVIILLLVALGGASYYYYTYLTNKDKKNIEEISNKNNEALLVFNETLEYGSELSYSELLNKLVNLDGLNENTDIKISINDVEFINDTVYKFDSIGNYSIKVLLTTTYEHNTINNSKESEIIVEDTKFPVILGVTDKEITVGDEINLLEGISAQDEVDGELEVIVNGELDNKKSGEYIITVSATDKNGNVTDKEFKVIVKEKEIATTKPNNTASSNSTTTKPTTSNSTSSSNNTTNNSATTSSTSNSSSSSSSTSTPSNDSSTKNGRLQIATTEAKRVVSQIIKSGMSDYDKAYAIFNYLHSNVSLQTNQSSEAYQTNYGNEAYAALIMKKAACSGFCKAVTLMCNAAGLQSKHINANQWTHQWNTVLVNGEWIIVDAQGGIFGGTVHPLEY